MRSQLMPCAGPKERALVEYAFATLDALGWRWGPAHIELMSTVDGPRLIEVRGMRCRFLNGCDASDGPPMASLRR